MYDLRHRLLSILWWRLYSGFPPGYGRRPHVQSEQNHESEWSFFLENLLESNRRLFLSNIVEMKMNNKGYWIKVVIGVLLVIMALGIVVCSKEHGDESCQKTLADGEMKIKGIVASNFTMKALLGGSLVPDEDTGDKIETIEFCGVTFGVNVQWIGSDDNKVPKSITLLTSHQDKKSFEAIKEGISKFLGSPNNEEYEVGDDNRVYGRVEWNKGFSVTLRNIHSDEGGLIIFIM